jgi:hypothetical protein
MKTCCAAHQVNVEDRHGPAFCRVSTCEFRRGRHTPAGACQAVPATQDRAQTANGAAKLRVTYQKSGARQEAAGVQYLHASRPYELAPLTERI